MIRALRFALGWAAFTWLLCCSCSATGYDPAVVGTWRDASYRPIVLTLGADGEAVYSSPTRTGAGVWDIDEGGRLRYRWTSGTSPATVVGPYDVTDGGDTLVTTAWDEVLTMVRQ